MSDDKEMPLELAQVISQGGEGKKDIDPQLAVTAREVAAEGAVLLKNDQQMLPLRPGERVAVFGRVQINYFFVGYGSGGAVNPPYKIHLLEGLREKKDIILDEAVADVYETWCREHVPQEEEWGNWPRHYEEMPLCYELISGAATRSKKALVVIGRAAGEDRDNALEKGSYYLTDEETDMLDQVTQAFEQTAVILNIGAVMDLSWVEKYGEHLQSVLLVWQGGMESGRAAADVLCGELPACGKLSDTIAYRYEDYPSAPYFGNKEYNNYVEDIFVGYRFFETFCPAKVQYPFGYGMGYTSFSFDTEKCLAQEDKIIVTCLVKNTGVCYAGKEVVQVYYSAPQGALGKASRVLGSFKKTRLLQPGEEERLTLEFPVTQMASFDDGGYTGNKSAYVLEAGIYGIYVGTDVHTAEKVGEYRQEKLCIAEQLTETAAVKPENGFVRIVLKKDGSGKNVMQHENVPTASHGIREEILNHLPEEIPQTGDQGYKLLDVKKNSVSMDSFIAQLSNGELEVLSRGDILMNSPLGAPGNTGVYGGSTESLREKGIPPITTTDGPSGIRLNNYASLLPGGMTLACTWNPPLINKLYALESKEMKEKGSDVLLAPGMNIHRNPLCGRNFEYFSEDPYLTGKTAAAVVRGIQQEGVSACPKHFVCNHQESNRNKNDSRVSERALREIYLKGFEICIKEARPLNIMTSYNKINGVWGHYHYELCTDILRKEWGYEGCVMTDWWMQPSVDPDFEKLRDNAYRIRAQVDVLMPGGTLYQTDRKPDLSLLEHLGEEEGITLGELQRSARNVLNLCMHYI